MILIFISCKKEKKEKEIITQEEIYNIVNNKIFPYLMRNRDSIYLFEKQLKYLDVEIDIDDIDNVEEIPVISTLNHIFYLKFTNSSWNKEELNNVHLVSSKYSHLFYYGKRNNLKNEELKKDWLDNYKGKSIYHLSKPKYIKGGKILSFFVKEYHPFSQSCTPYDQHLLFKNKNGKFVFLWE